MAMRLHALRFTVTMMGAWPPQLARSADMITSSEIWSGRRTSCRSEWCGRDTFAGTCPLLGLPRPRRRELEHKTPKCRGCQQRKLNQQLTSTLTSRYFRPWTDVRVSVLRGSLIVSSPRFRLTWRIGQRSQVGRERRVRAQSPHIRKGVHRRRSR